MSLRPATRDDVADILALYLAFDIAKRGFPDSDETDVTGDWDVPGFSLDTQTRVLEDGRRVRGYAVVDTRGEGDTVVDLTGGDELALTEVLLDWLETTAPRVQHYVQASDVGLSDLFARRGWAPERTFWRMRIEHDAPSPAPVWPDGVTVRGVDPDRDGPAVHEVVMTAFGDIGDPHWTPKPYDEWAAYLLHPERFDAELYLLAEEDGEVVGVCLGQDVTDYCFVRQLAVPRAQRGRGLALALLHEEFRRAAARGLPATALGVDAENEAGATRLYERAGMRVHEEFRLWARER